MENPVWAGCFGHAVTKEKLEHFCRSNMYPTGLILSGKESIGKDFLALRFSLLFRYGADPDNLPELLNHLSFEQPSLKYIFALPRGNGEQADDGPYDKLSNDDIKKIKAELEKKRSNPYHQLNIERANDIKITSIRNIRQSFSLAFARGEKRVVIISKAHDMSVQAQNALLKILEEPPPDSIFILTTHLPELLLPTIHSRCWMIPMASLQKEELQQILMQYYDLNKQNATEAALLAEGSVQDAMKYIHYRLDDLKKETIIILRHAMAGYGETALSAIESFQKSTGDDAMQLLVQLMTRWFRDLLLYRSGLPAEFFFEEQSTFEKFTTKYPFYKIDAMLKILDTISSQVQHQNINKNIANFRLVNELSSSLRM